MLYKSLGKRSLGIAWGLVNVRNVNVLINGIQIQHDMFVAQECTFSLCFLLGLFELTESLLLP